MITLAKLLFTLLLQWQGNHPELTQFLYKNTMDATVSETKVEVCNPDQDVTICSINYSPRD